MSTKELLVGRTESDWVITKNDVICTLRAAALIIKNDKLLVAKDRDYDCYYAIGGGIQINETSENAVIREVYEETGYTLEVDKLAFVQERFLRVDEQQHHEIGFFYLMKDNVDLIILDNRMTDHPKETLHWLPLNELHKANIVPNFLKSKSLCNITDLEHIVLME